MTATQFTTAEELREQRRIEIGYYPDTFKPFQFYDYFKGDAYLIVGMTSVGKSILAGNIFVDLAEQRPLLLFDYRGDYKNLKYLNYQNKHHIYKCIPDLVYIHNFGFKIQDFTNPFDWEMMGMTGNGARLCASKAKMVLYHRNNFQRFKELIEEVRVFGKDEHAEAWKMTKQSILAKLDGIRHAFVDDNAVDITYRDDFIYKGIPFYVSDWKYFLKKHKHVCLNMHADTNPRKAQLFIGKIMNEIEPIMKETSHVIGIEEAHKACPAVIDDDSFPYSVIKVLNYLKEYHKDGVKLILITQYPHQVQEEVLDEIKRFFVGKLQNIKGYSQLDEMFKLSKALQFNFIQNYREFWHYSPIYNEKEIFVPYDSFTFYEKRR